MEPFLKESIERWVGVGLAPFPKRMYDCMKLYCLHKGSKSKAGSDQKSSSSHEEAIADQSSSQIVEWDMEEPEKDGLDKE
eukprot:12589174-Ditylum_brightwellii.AAC.1